jgi:hypothetical protein
LTFAPLCVKTKWLKELKAPQGQKDPISPPTNLLKTGSQVAEKGNLVSVD